MIRRYYMMLSYNKLWKLIIDKGINKTQLREMTGITTNILAKLGKNESVQIEVLAKICEVFECDLTDIVEIKKSN
jgi:putative transcriptional regulator